VNENDLYFSSNLKSLNLNSNSIKKIHDNSLRNLLNLRSFKISRNNLEKFDMLILNWVKILELDLSFNSLNLNETSHFLDAFNKIENYSLENVKFCQQSNMSIRIFINTNIKYLDFSGNYFKRNDFKMFDNLTNLISLELRQVNIQSMEWLNFKNYKNLIHLDLSFNNLTEVNFESLKELQHLQYLDLSNNKIFNLNGKMFEISESNKIKPLNYINLENNQITFIENKFYNYLNLNVIKLSYNFLNDTPMFNLNWTSDWTSLNKQFYVNHNKLSIIKSFAFCLNSLEILNFDNNQIFSIEFEAFSNLKSLKNLSISNNNLVNVTKDNFYFLYGLEYLNLSINKITSIEINSFINLNKLVSLDLSFNNLHLIDSNVFNGLTYLDSLNLLDDQQFLLSNKSFSSLLNIGNVYLKKSILVDNVCLFTYSFEREIKRKLGNKYTFYKSINVLTDELSRLDYDSNKCALTFHLFQFKIHFNLKSDHENELFYEKCKENLIVESNSFYRNYEKCLDNFSQQKEMRSKKTILNDEERFFKILTDYNFYLIMGLILSLLVPVFALISIHLMKNKIKSDQLNKKEKSSRIQHTNRNKSQQVISTLLFINHETRHIKNNDNENDRNKNELNSSRRSVEYYNSIRIMATNRQPNNNRYSQDFPSLLLDLYNDILGLDSFKLYNEVSNNFRVFGLFTIEAISARELIISNITDLNDFNNFSSKSWRKNAFSYKGVKIIRILSKNKDREFKCCAKIFGNVKKEFDGKTWKNLHEYLHTKLGVEKVDRIKGKNYEFLFQSKKKKERAIRKSFIQVYSIVIMCREWKEKHKEKNFRACSNCNLFGHTGKKCNFYTLCKYCGSEGDHKSRDCQYKKITSRHYCAFCNINGHFVNEKDYCNSYVRELRKYENKLVN